METNNALMEHLEEVLDEPISVEERRDLARTAVALALEGDVGALRLCLGRLIPSRLGRRVRVDLPPIACAGDVTAALDGVVREAARGPE